MTAAPDQVPSASRPTRLARRLRPGPRRPRPAGEPDPGLVHAPGRPLAAGVPGAARGDGDARGLPGPRPGHRDHPAAGPPARRGRRDPLLRHRGAAGGRRDGRRDQARRRARSSPSRCARSPTSTRCRRWSPSGWPSCRRRCGQLVAELGATPLIGFAGAPFTLASYLIEGGPSKEHARTKAFMYAEPEAWARLLDRLADLGGHVPAGPGRRRRLRGPAVRLVGRRALGRRLRRARAAALARGVRRARRPRRAADPLRRGHRRAAAADRGRRRRRRRASTGGCRWTRPPAGSGPGRSLQGNLDPAVLLADRATVDREVRRVVEQGRAARGHIFNLGHGVLPDTDPGVLTHVADLVHELTVRPPTAPAHEPAGRRRGRDHRPRRRLRVAAPASGRRDRRPRGGRPDRREAAPGRAGRALVRHRRRGGAGPRARGGRAGRGAGAGRRAGRARRRCRPPSSCRTGGTRCPAGTVLGVPASADGLDGLLSPDGVARVRAEADLPPVRFDGDVARRRPAARAARGRGGRPAGRAAAGRGLRRAGRRAVPAATMPALAAELPGARSVLAAAAAARDAGARSRGDDDGPVFAHRAVRARLAAGGAGGGRPGGGPAAHPRARAPADGVRVRAVGRPGRRAGAADRRRRARDRPGAEGGAAAARAGARRRSSRCRGSRTRRWRSSRWRSRRRTWTPGRGCSCRRSPAGWSRA